MKRTIEIAVQIVTLIVVGVLGEVAVEAQNAAPVSLEEQLEAEYKLAKISHSRGQVTVTEPGTVLVIQQAGILGVPPGNLALAPAAYKDGSLHPPGGFASGMVGKNARQLSVGEKVYVTKLEVNLKRDKVWFRIIECDACNGTSEPSSYKSDVIFDFPKGSLARTSVPDVEDTIAKVFAIDTGPPAAQAAQPQTQPEQPAALQAAPAREVAPAQALTNDDIIKLVQVKLGDSLIITKIKSSACAFDTSTDALVKLKAAGVSDAVLQAMVEVGGQPAAAPPPPQIEERPGGGGPEAFREYKLLHFQYLSPELHEVVIRIGGGTVSFDPGDQPCTFKAFTAPITAVTSVEVIRKFSGEMLEIKVRDPAKNKVRSLNFAPIGSYLRSRSIGPAVLEAPAQASSELENVKRALESAVAK